MPENKLVPVMKTSGARKKIAGTADRRAAKQKRFRNFRWLGVPVLLILLGVAIFGIFTTVERDQVWNLNEQRRNNVFAAQALKLERISNLSTEILDTTDTPQRTALSAELSSLATTIATNQIIVSGGSDSAQQLVDHGYAWLGTEGDDGPHWKLLAPSEGSVYRSDAVLQLQGDISGEAGLSKEIAALVATTQDVLVPFDPNSVTAQLQTRVLAQHASALSKRFATLSASAIETYSKKQVHNGRLITVVGISVSIGLLLVVILYNSFTLRRRVAFAEAHDPLTGLGNRKRFQAHVDHLMRPRSMIGSVAIVLIDLDEFADVNRQLGATAGDHVLEVTARRISAQLREHDIAARLGGDLFVVACASVDEEAVAESIAQRLAHVIADPIELSDDLASLVTASIGVTIMRTDQDSLDAALDRCRVACRSAKLRGRGLVEMFSRALQDSLEAEARLETELRRAIDHGELVVYYQPEVDLATGELLGSEALVRWMHPDRGLIFPGDFIPVAESSGLVIDLGAYVLLEACRQAGEWNRRYPNLTLKMRVNISARQLESPDIVALVTQAIAISGVEASRLCLEITESALMVDPETAAGLLQRLATLGVRLAIDDFGTGYSSLAYLEQFPVDVLKIDRTFVDGIVHDAAKNAIVGAVIGLARALGLHVTGEGVETLEQCRALVELGCRTGQGFFFEKAVPPQTIDALLATTMGLARPLVGVTEAVVPDAVDPRAAAERRFGVRAPFNPSRPSPNWNPGALE